MNEIPLVATSPREARAMFPRNKKEINKIIKQTKII